VAVENNRNKKEINQEIDKIRGIMFFFTTVGGAFLGKWQVFL
jgi:hypothetical protein